MKDISTLGFGCYRVDHRFIEHSDALKYALQNGINLIDTSANYSDGRSEILVGNVIDDLVSEGALDRDKLTIVTKVGYIQGQNHKLALKKKEGGHPFTDVVEYSEGLWHCISPDFIDDQLKRQLTRLNQDFIDVYLLHNPEYFLLDSQKQKRNQDEAQQEYYTRIRKAFEFLEQKVSDGVIRYYGISSNTFPASNDKYSYTSFENILEIAAEISPESNFKFIQLPFNVVESGAILTQNQIGGTQSVIELASVNRIKVLINRPLNTVSSKGLVRTVDFEITDFSEKDFSGHLNECLGLEQSLEEFFSKDAGEEFYDMKKNFGMAKAIDKNWRYFGGIENFNDTVEYYFSPRLNAILDFIENNSSNTDLIKTNSRYVTTLNVLLNMLGAYYKLNTISRSKLFHDILNKYLDPGLHGLTLSQKSLLLISSVKGVDCVLVGARKKEYVEDATKVTELEKLKNADDIFREINNDLVNAGYFAAEI